MTAAASAALYAGCAAFSLLLTALILVAGRGSAALLPAAAAAGTGIWAAAVALEPATPLNGLAGVLEILRAVLWFAVLFGLAWRFAGQRARPLLRRFAAGATVVAATAIVVELPVAQGVLAAPSFASLAILARIALALLVVLLAEISTAMPARRRAGTSTCPASRWAASPPSMCCSTPRRRSRAASPRACWMRAPR